MDWADELSQQQAHWNQILYWAHYKAPVFRFVQPSPDDIFQLLEERLMITHYEYSRTSPYHGGGYRGSDWMMPQYGCDMAITTLTDDPQSVEFFLREVIKDLQVKGAYVQIENFEWKRPENIVTVRLSLKTQDMNQLHAIRDYAEERF